MAKKRARKGAGERPGRSEQGGRQRPASLRRSVAWWGAAVCLLACVAGGVLHVSMRGTPGGTVPEDAAAAVEEPAAAAAVLPPDAAPSFTHACALIAQGRSAEAEPLLRTLVERLSARGAARDAVRLVHFNLCVALRGAGREDDALRAALKWLDESPREPSHNLIAGAILYDRFMYAEAVPYLEKGLAGGGGDAARGITSDPLRIDCQLADCYRRTGRPDDAAAIIERVLARDPAQWEARRLAGLLAYARHDFENAMDTFEALLAQRPADVSAVTNLASTAIAAGDGARALAAIKTHLAAGGDEKTVRLLRARALSATGDHHGAVASAATILVLAPEPESDEVFLVLADSLSRAGQPDIARPFLERYQRGVAMRSELERAATAARMGSQSSSAYYRGRAYARAGRPGEALRELHRARAMAPRNGQVIAELARVLLDVERPLDAQDLLDDFERAAAAEPFPLPAEFFMARAELALAFGAFDAAQDAIGRACDVGRCERDIAALAARLALASGRVDVLELPLRVLERAVGIDADAQVWVAIEAFLRGETRAASEALDSAADKGDSSDPCVLLARARARAALGRRAEAAEDYRALIQGEQLLVEAWEGLKAVTGDEAERVRAAQWLEARDMHQAALAGGWRRLHGQTEQRACARALVEASRIRARMGMRSRARSLAALARDMDRVSADAHGQVLTVFDRPEDVFQRIHSLEALIRLEPGDQDLETRRQREYQAIGFTPPDRDAP